MISILNGMTTKRDKALQALGLEDANGWPERYAESFAGVPSDVRRPLQGEPEQRERIVITAASSRHP
jgi:hypothetical protein